MHYNIIRKMDISDGPGVRISIFMQGCTFNCKNCFNQETHDFDGGKEFNEDIINKIIELGKEDYISGLSILGGEPLHPKNIKGSTELAKAFKNTYPNKTIWVWSGYKFEDLKEQEIFKYIDVLVDGQYVDELHDFRLLFRGSKNQRVINIPSTLKSQKIQTISDEDLVNIER